MVNVDFEWFDPSEIDFHGLKILLRQLFDTDAQEFDLSALADLILSQPLLGSTVKVDGKESDPYAFLSVLNLQEHKVLSIADSTAWYREVRAIANCLSRTSLLSKISLPTCSAKPLRKLRSPLYLLSSHKIPLHPLGLS